MVSRIHYFAVAIADLAVAAGTGIAAVAGRRSAVEAQSFAAHCPAVAESVVAVEHHAKYTCPHLPVLIPIQKTRLSTRTPTGLCKTIYLVLFSFHYLFYYF